MFLADMGERPEGTTLDRINSAGDYEPGNCRWATLAEQARNYSRNRILEVDGRRMTATDWAIELGLKPQLVLSRLRRGESTQSALQPEITPRRRRPRDTVQP